MEVKRSPPDGQRLEMISNLHLTFGYVGALHSKSDQGPLRLGYALRAEENAGKYGSPSMVSTKVVRGKFLRSWRRGCAGIRDIRPHSHLVAGVPAATGTSHELRCTPILSSACSTWAGKAAILAPRREPSPKLGGPACSASPCTRCTAGAAAGADMCRPSADPRLCSKVTNLSPHSPALLQPAPAHSPYPRSHGALHRVSPLVMDTASGTASLGLPSPYRSESSGDGPEAVRNNCLTTLFVHMRAWYSGRPEIQIPPPSLPLSYLPTTH